MTPIRWVVLGILVAAIALVQRCGLDRQPEEITEKKYRNLADVPAGDMVPTYVASLFFGAFRAVAIDVLWIQLKRVREEKRWEEEKQIFTFISYFQARNPEVWSHLGWDSAYNVANSFTDPEKKWEWYAYGLKWLRKGNKMLPDSIYLKEQLAYTLWHKPLWPPASVHDRVDRWLLERFERDVALQEELLPPGHTWERPIGMFEMAALWLERARQDAFASKEVRHKTFTGRLIYRSTLDGFLQGCLYLQGAWEMTRGKVDEAKTWFRRALDQVERMLQAEREGFYPEHLSDIFKARRDFYTKLPGILDLQERAKSEKPEDLKAFLAALQPVLVEHGTLDDGFYWRQGDPEAPLNRLKQKLAGGQDPLEFNDAEPFASPLKEGDFALANLEPPGMDQDFFVLTLNPESGPLKVKLLFNEGITAPPLRLKVDVRFGHKTLAEAVVEGRRAVDFTAAEPGSYRVQVEPADRPDPWPDRTRYSLQFRVER